MCHSDDDPSSHYEENAATSNNRRPQDSALAVSSTTPPRMENNTSASPTIQASLEDVEQQLTTTEVRSAGRAVMQSIRSALSGIRSRLEQSRSSCEEEDALWHRLRQAEMAHSNHIPLALLQQVLERRRSTSTVNSGDNQHVAEGTPKRDEEDSSMSETSTSRVSALLASRRLPDPAPDRDIHSSVASLFASFSPGQKKNIDNEENDEDDRPSVLLTKKSRSSLDMLQEHILFPDDVQNSVLSSEDQDAATQNSIYSWGSGINSFHDDCTERSVDAGKVAHARSFAAIAVGDHHIAAATKSGTVFTAGHNLSGEVDPTDRNTSVVEKPKLMESLPFQAVIVAVSCGHDHTAALRSNGNVLTWGGNEYGQLGHRNTNTATSNFFCRPAVMALAANQRATAVACGDGFTLCLTSRMELLACGVSDIACKGSTPKAIPALKTLPIVKIAAGRRHAIAITSHGTAFAWGDNESGNCGQEFPNHLGVPVMVKIGHAGTEHRALPAPLSNWIEYNTEDTENKAMITIPSESSISYAACGADHTILISRSGSAYVFGRNEEGQLGLDPKEHSIKIVAPKVMHHPMTSDRKFVKAEAGNAHTILLDDAGDVWQMGNGQHSCECVLEGHHIQTIGAGGEHSVAISGDMEKLTREMSDSLQKDEDLQISTDCLEGLLTLLASQSTNDADLTATKLTARTEELLRTPAVLNSLFMNPNELDDLFKKLLRVDMPGFEQAVASSIERGMMRGLDSVREDEEIRLMWPEQVRFLLLMLQCPLFVDWKTDSRILFDRRGDLMLSLCDAILSLPFEGYRALMIWAAHAYNATDFNRLILKPLHSQLSKCLSVEAGAERRPMKGIVSIMKWLHVSSQKSGGVAKAEDFYNSSVCEMSIDALFNDLQRYKNASELQRKADFFLSANPFLMCPSTKRNLLHFENQFQMYQSAGSSVMFNPTEGSIEFRPYFVIAIDRQYLLPQTLDKISRAPPLELRKKLKVIFKGEDGVDGGGITREFFQLLTEHLFDRRTGMWTSRYGEETTWFNGDCFWNDEGYYLSGVLVGLAVYNSVLLDVTFPQALYRKLLGLPLGLEDMIDEQTKAGLHNLLAYEGDDVEDVFCLSFDVSWNDLGEEKRKELKPGGSGIPVTSENKEEYVLLYVRWLLVDSIKPQYEAFESGFMKVMEESSLELLSPEELELMVVGSRELDFEALENHTEYEGGFDRETPVIRNLWNYLKNASRDEQLKFLKFTTGSPKAPIGGLGNMPFKVQRAGPDGIMLPTSHTCFNTLLLPDYGDSYDKLTKLLGRAIKECEGFGLQ